MRIIIVGAGKIGEAIVRYVSSESHEVVVIDDDSKVVETIVNQYDVMGICGNGASYEILKNAGVERTDLFIAVTTSDEGNMLACLIAKKLGAKETIARVRDRDYTSQLPLLKEALNITMTINPELESALEIARIIKFPEALKVETFASGNANLVELYIDENSPLVGKSLVNLTAEHHLDVLVCAISRNNDVLIPKGNFILQAKDRIHVCLSEHSSRKFVNKLYLQQKKIRDVLIVGGGRMCQYLCKELLDSKYNVKIIEKDIDVCRELSENLPQATVVCGDATNQNLLEEEGLGLSDAVITLTGSDEENIIISLYANSKNVKKVITKVNKVSFGDLLTSVKMGSVFSSQEIAAYKIVSYIRANCNVKGNNVRTLYKLVNDRVEALEFVASKSSKLLNVPLKDLTIKSDILIGGIIRDGILIIPRGDSTILENDNVIVVTTSSMLNDLDDILE